MKIILASILSVILILTVINEFSTGKSQPKHTAITNVNLISMTGTEVEKDISIVITDNKISWIGNADKLPAYNFDKIINGKNKFLMPGLIDCHVHIRSEKELVSYLYYGITSVIQLSGSAKMDLLELRENVKSGEIIGPDIYLSGPILDGNPPIWSGPVSLAIESKKEAKNVVIEQINSGYDFIKIYNRLLTPEFDEIMRVSKSKGIGVIGHIPRKPGAVHVLNSGISMIAHIEEFFFTYFDCIDCGLEKLPDYNKIPELLKIVKKNDVWITANLSFITATRSMIDDFESILTDPEFSFLSNQTQQTWRKNNPHTRSDFEFFNEREKIKHEFCKILAAEFHKANIPLLAGSDASAPGMFPGRSLHQELQELSKTGIENYSVIETATSIAGAFITKYGSQEYLDFGVIKTGSEADLILLNTNPLENLNFQSEIVLIITNGKIYDRNELMEYRLNGKIK